MVFLKPRSLNKKEIQLNLCKIFSVLIFRTLFIRLMTLNCTKLGLAVTLMKYLSSVISLIFLPKTLIWNKITFRSSNSLNLAKLVANELLRSISKKFTNIPFSLRFIAAFCKDFRNLSLKNEITFKKSWSVWPFINHEQPVLEFWGLGRLKWKFFKRLISRDFP